MAESLGSLKTDQLFLGLTRPAMIAGVSNTYVGMEALIAMMGFIATSNFLFFVALFVLHGIGYVLCKNDNIDVLINNAGFGLCDNFLETDLEKELEMINTNIKAVHVLTKLFLKDMKKRDSGYILNVASLAAFMPGPLMTTYYATKSYVFKFTTAIYEELRRDKSNVVISCLCPGPVETNFNNVADVTFSVKGMNSKFVAKYAIDNMFKKKLIIIPGTKMKMAAFFSRFLSTKKQAKITYNIQKKKMKSRKDK